MRRVLITGGAGFIGSHVADELIARGYAVRALDNLSPEVHDSGFRPRYLHPEVELRVGDVRDPETVRSALADVDSVIHLAALVGSSQSMYELREYTSVNALGTAVLLEGIIRRPVRRLVVASGMSVYGEGRYHSPVGSIVDDAERIPEVLRAGHWDPEQAGGTTLVPVPTPEDKRPHLSSVYALSKFEQEELCLMVGRAYGIPTVALRVFNTYGPRQALSKPHTGVLAIFASRLLDGKRPRVFEDGRQMRDFVSVHDVARAFVLALSAPRAAFHAINIGSGEPVSVGEVARRLASAIGRDIEPEITERYRFGDVRHCFGTIETAEELLGYRPSVTLETGIRQLASWLSAIPKAAGPALPIEGSP